MLGSLPVRVHPWAKEDGLRAEGLCSGGGHGRVDAKAAGLVTTGCYDTAARRISTDDDGFASQIRVVPLFDSGKECIHVDMDNFAIVRGCCATIVRQP
jgi:hypothetical protein